jgi:hypothetical protein
MHLLDQYGKFQLAKEEIARILSSTTRKGSPLSNYFVSEEGDAASIIFNQLFCLRTSGILD